MPKLGQHFLKNEEIVETIIAGLDLRAGEAVIEIGPGAGALTLPLLRACQEKKCTLIAIEKDEALASLLQYEITKQGGAIEIVKADALAQLPKITSRYKLQATTYKLVGNIPYYITGSLLRLIGELEQKPALTILMVQEEVADRVSAVPPRMNLLAAATQAWADIEIIARVGKKDFDPPPEVDSAVIKLTTNDLQLTTQQLGTYYSCIKAVFKQPRKTLLNNISEGTGLSKQEITEKLEKIGFEPGSRGQNLSIEDLLSLSKAFEFGDRP